MAFLDRLGARLQRPIDLASLAVMRVLFGTLMVVEVLRYTLFGWISDYYLKPETHFTYFGWSWIKPWDGGGMYIQFALIALVSISIVLGFRARLSFALFCVLFGHVFLMDQAYYLNHLYLVCCLGIVFSMIPSGAVWGLDARRCPQLGRGWMLDLVRFQVGVVYVFGGIAKLNGDWLAAQPLRRWMSAREEMPYLGAFLQEAWVPWVLSYGGLAFDLCVVPLLIWRRTRLFAFLLAIAFHLANAVLFNIGIFPWLAIALTTVFFDPDWPRRFIKWGSAPTVLAMNYRPLLVVAGLWAFIQIAMPVRHLAYPGNVAWTEEGHRFSWRMKLRSKSGRVKAHARNPVTGDEAVVRPETFYTRYQVRKMSTRPDLILQFAHDVRDKLTAEGWAEVEVRVAAYARLNGRPKQRLIKRHVDLAKVERSLQSSDWIEPLDHPLPD